MSRKIRVGVISDTHGLLRTEVVSSLRGVDHILHAGDIGSSEVLQALRPIAPVTAVRGNTDRGTYARDLPQRAKVELGEVSLCIVHELDRLGLDPRAEGFAVVISGHTHRAKMELTDGVLFFNPGSAGPRRFHYPVTLGFLLIRDSSVTGDILVLQS